MPGYLTKQEFYEYMAKMQVDLEKRLSRLENKVCKEAKNGNNNWKEKLIILLLGAVLVLAGVVTGWQFF